MVAVMSAGTPPDHRFELIQGLRLEAGRIMEDASPDLALPTSPEVIVARVEQLRQAAEDIMALATAAAALARQS